MKSVCNQGMKNALLLTNNETYSKIRKAYSTGLQMSQFSKQYSQLKNVMNRVVAFIESGRKQGQIEFQELCIKLTMDIVGVVGFETNSEDWTKPKSFLMTL